MLTEVVIDDWANADPAARQPPPELVAMAREHPGYGLTWTSRLTQVRREWSKERRAAERQRRLRKRMERKFPMFAEQFVQQVLQEQPAYYAAEHPFYDAGRPGGPPAREEVSR